MAWTTMHFAAGMVGSGVIGAGLCIIIRRGWRWVPLGMTLGGFWALVPDLPRLFREDFPSLPFASTLGSTSLEHWLHRHGDVFFAHARLDAQPKEFALHGLIIIIALYTMSICGYVFMLGRRAKPEAQEVETPQLPSHLRYTSSEQTATPIRIDPRANHDPAGDVLARMDHDSKSA